MVIDRYLQSILVAAIKPIILMVYLDFNWLFAPVVDRYAGNLEIPGLNDDAGVSIDDC